MNVETNQPHFYSFELMPTKVDFASKKTGFTNNSKLIGYVALGALALLAIVGNGVVTKILWNDQDHVNNTFPKDFSNDTQVGQLHPITNQIFTTQPKSLDFEPFAGIRIEDDPDIEEGHVKIKNAIKLHHFSTALVVSTVPQKIDLIWTRKPLGLQLETEFFVSSNSDIESLSSEPNLINTYDESESKFSLIKDIISSFHSLERVTDILPKELPSFCTELSLSKLMYNEISVRNYFDIYTGTGFFPFFFPRVTEIFNYGLIALQKICLMHDLPLSQYNPIMQVTTKRELLSALLNRIVPSTLLLLNSFVPIHLSSLNFVAINSLNLIGQSFHYGLAIAKSGQYFVKNQFSRMDIIKYSFIGMMGGYGMLSTLIKGNDLYQGAQLFSNLDDLQQKAVLKHRAIHHLATEKNCNAVIIDGMSSEWGEKKASDDRPFPLGRFLYNKCRTLSFRATSSQNLCQALKQARDYFDSPIDILSLHGHANGEHMDLNQNYYFIATDSELECIDTTIKTEGEIFFLGCNTATRDVSPDRLSLTEHVSKKLSTRKVTGTKAYFFPDFSYPSFSNGSLSLRAYGFSFSGHGFKNSKDEWVIGNLAVTYQNGIEIT